MWVSRVHYETLFENLTKDRIKAAEAQARIAAMQATQDWLMAHVNRLETERALLTQARLGLAFPVPELSRHAGPPGIESHPFRDESVTRGLPPDAVPLAQLMGASMEDMGDEQAARLGVGHDAQGFVTHR